VIHNILLKVQSFPGLPCLILSGAHRLTVYIGLTLYIVLFCLCDQQSIKDQLGNCTLVLVKPRHIAFVLVIPNP
jgi:hypothetical protein